MIELQITNNEAGQRLDKFLGKYMKKAPKSFLYKMMRKKNIVLNGKKASGNEILVSGDLVKLFLSQETIDNFSESIKETKNRLSENRQTFQLTKAEILYEDPHILLINKPAGLLSQKAEKDSPSLTEAIIRYLLQTDQLAEASLRTFRPSVCNRLDRNTSGIVAAGKSLVGLQELSRLFKNRSLRKYYRCITKGSVRKPAHICGWLTKDSKTNTVHIADVPSEDGSLRIETEYTPLTCRNGISDLEVHLITGRTHQIRAHLAGTGHPIIGDPKYGDKRLNRFYQEKYGVKTQLLHACRLEFPDLDGPLSYLSGKTVTAPLPMIFETVRRGEE